MTEYEILKDNAHKFVIETMEEIENLIDSKIEKIHPSQRWVIKGRILNILFNCHYGFTIMKSEEMIKLKEENADS